MFSQPELLRKTKRLRSIFEDFALSKNLIKGHHNYTKFIILSRSRSGSNLLLNLLQSHANVRMFYEPFNKVQSEKSFLDFVNYKFEEVELIKQNNPIQYIDEYIFRKMPDSVKAVGFKLFYYHAQEGEKAKIWQHLKNQQELKIIHLTRKNVLKAYVSQQLAFKTDTWIGTGKFKKKEPLKIQLDYEQTLKAFEQTKLWEEKYESFFSNHQIIRVFYEDLVKNHVEVIKNLQKFLELDYQSVNISTKKQSKESLEKTVLNFTELKQKFVGTPWITFFD